MESSLNLKGVAVVSAVLFASLSQAVLFSYTFRGNASGSIGASSFTAANFVIDVRADTSSVGPGPFGSIATPSGSPATITIAGIGTATFLPSANASVFYSQSNGIVGFWNYGNLDYLDVRTTLGPTYGLTTAAGPETGQVLAVNQFNGVGTTLGQLGLEPSSISTATFQAAPVPEPATMALLSIGFAALVRRRRNAKR